MNQNIVIFDGDPNIIFFDTVRSTLEREGGLVHGPFATEQDIEDTFSSLQAGDLGLKPVLLVGDGGYHHQNTDDFANGILDKIDEAGLSVDAIRFSMRDTRLRNGKPTDPRFVAHVTHNKYSSLPPVIDRLFEF